MKTKTSLLINSLILLSLGCFADENALEERTGRITAKIATSEPRENLLARSSEPISISVEVNGKKAEVAVELKATRHIVEQWRNGKKERVMPLIEFSVESKGQTAFKWSCWESANASPHDFKLFTTSVGNTYVCYVSIEGIKLFRISESNDSEMARRAFLEKNADTGALPPLRTSFLRSAAGKEHFFTLDALYDAITVNNITEVDGNLRIKLHGNKPAPQFTFELKNSEWRRVGE